VPGVSESSTIDAIVWGLRVDNCQDVLDRIKPKSLQELFEVMQNTANLTKAVAEGWIEPMQPRSKSSRVSGTCRRDGRIIHRSSRTVKSTTHLHPPIKTRAEAVVDTKEGTRMVGGRSPPTASTTPRGGERFFCWLHGISAYHHTHHCPSTIKKKMEWEAEEKAKTTGLVVNHVMKYQNSGQFRALSSSYHPHQPFKPSAPTQAFNHHKCSPFRRRSCDHLHPCICSHLQYLCLCG
jgi:hypothetical protein